MKSCKQCQRGFEVTTEDRQFYDRISPSFDGKKYAIPEPTLCPDCRQQRRLAQCNESFLYPAECDLCHKRILSQFSPTTQVPVYCRECWHSDKWDPSDFGQEFDFSRSFFEQLSELKRRTPSQALNVQGTMINSDYVHCAGSCKNCYLIMHADFCEDCYYGYGFKKNKFCVDGFYNLHSEWCYEGVDVHKSYGLIASQDCLNCHSSAFLRDCIGCKNCFLSVGLRQKEYCFENKQLSKAEYEQKMATIDLGSYSQYQGYKKRLAEMQKGRIVKEYAGHNLHESSGDHLTNCKNVQNCFDCEDVENGKFCYQVVLGGKNIYDINQYGTNLQESYECTISGENAYRLLFTDDGNISCSNLTYCWYMEVSKDCFGCANMHHRSYCILNKQYTKEQYEALVPKIIEHMKRSGEWGEFFPASISLFGYNKTTAQMYYPLTKDQALTQGFCWDDYEPAPPAVQKIIPAHLLPDNISAIPDDVLNWAIECEVTHKPFKITPQELEFYRKMKLPLPRRSPHVRHLDRFQQRNPRRLYERVCAQCQKSIRTTWSPERSEKVYCERCYGKEIY